MKKLFEWVRNKHADAELCLFLAAAVIGIVQQALHPGDPGDEMLRLAGGIARDGLYASLFGVLPTGPTAMVPPGYPVFLAGLILVLRNPLLIYQATIAGAIAANAATAALLPRVSSAISKDYVPGFVAGALWLASMQALPGWDTNYTVAGLLLFAVLSSSGVESGRAPLRLAVAAGMVMGIVFLLNPSTLLITLPWLAFVAFKMGPEAFRHWKRFAITLGILGLLGGAWCARNLRVLGSFVVRTNLGPTLFASNNDCASPSLIDEELTGCYQSHHPNTNLEEAKALIALGEVRYDHQRIEDTESWVRANPGRFFKLTAQRFLFFWFPTTESIPANLVQGSRSYAMPAYVRNWSRQQNEIAYMVWIVTAASIPGFIIMALRRELFTPFAGLILGVYPLLYYVVVTDMRYRYPVLWISLLCAGYLLREVVTPRPIAPAENMPAVTSRAARSYR